MNGEQMEKARAFYVKGLKQYGLDAKYLANSRNHVHISKREGKDFLICVNGGPSKEKIREIECPCASKRTDSSLIKWIDHFRQRPVTQEHAYAILCMLSSTKKTLQWRREHDPAEDEWGWDLHQAYLRGAQYAGPEPCVIEPVPPAIGIAPKEERRFAREIAAYLCSRSCIKKSEEKIIRDQIAKFLADKRLEYAEGFATWMLNVSSRYRVVVDDSDVERTEIRIRTGQKTSEVHIIENPRTKYEIHWPHSAPEGDREPKPWEIVYALLGQRPTEHDLSELVKHPHVDAFTLEANRRINKRRAKSGEK